jgi:hypothetical protein
MDYDHMPFSVDDPDYSDCDEDEPQTTEASHNGVDADKACIHAFVG